jgi:hypothetical protein
MHRNKFVSYLPVVTVCLLVSLACSLLGDVVNYYGISETITFSKMNYNLAWSSHPNTQYYKQEYIPQGNNIERYNDMIIIDFIQRDIPVIDALVPQLNKLEQRKKTDEICKYELIHSPDSSEYILDFLISESNGSAIKIVEWNAYHYKSYTDKFGHKGILLFGISHRSYELEAIAFLKSLKGYRDEHRKNLIQYPIPEIQIKI